MTREEVKTKILDIFANDFEIENPGLDDNLGEKYDFDSIDAIDLLVMIEKFLNISLNTDEKKGAVKIRTVNHIIDFVMAIQEQRQKNV